MKRWIFLFLLTVMISLICACGDIHNISDSISPKTDHDEKGSISNPYSLADEIIFTAQGYSSSGEKCTSTYNFSNILLRDDITFTGYEAEHSRWFITFTFEIAESETNEPFRPCIEGMIEFGNINSDGISGDYTSFPRGLNTYASVADIWGLEILPNTKSNVGCVLFNENGGTLSLITIEYHDESDTKQTIYIDPYK